MQFLKFFGISTLLLTCFLCLPNYASAKEVSLKLVIALDCSASIDPEEFKLQIDGVSAAFRDPEVVSAIERSTPNGIAISLVQWTGSGQQEQSIDWQKIVDRESAELAAQKIERIKRYLRFGATAIGEALFFSETLFAENNLESKRRHIAVVGDGASNQGEAVAVVRNRLVSAGFTIHALAVLTEDAYLDSYFRDQVVGGDNPIVTSALDYEEFAKPFKKLLLKIISSQQ